MGQYLAFVVEAGDQHRFLGEGGTDAQARALCEQEAARQGVTVTWTAALHARLGVTNWIGAVTPGDDVEGFEVQYLPEDHEHPPLPGAVPGTPA